jgi:hypothetical protein
MEQLRLFIDLVGLPNALNIERCNVFTPVQTLIDLLDDLFLAMG